MLDIRQTPMGGELRDFLDVVDVIYRDDPRYIRPLDMDLKDRLNPKKNPFFEHADGVVFTAHRGGKCVGRVTAQIDRDHLARYKDDVGFFGFIDTIDDAEVARELLARAERWLKDRGIKTVRGPFSLSINEEIGCLVEGFDAPPVLMTPHHRPYQGGLIEEAGYTKAKDVFGWRYEIGEPNARVKKAREDIRAMPEVTVRPISRKTVDRDVAMTLDIYNDAWSENWSYVPMSKREADKMAADLKLFLVPEITTLVLIDNEPAAVALALPNVNELISDLGGKLFPLGLPKLLYRLKVEGARSGRLIILGIKKKFRLQRKYAALSLFLYAEMNEGGRRAGMTWGELGWTLEDNAAVNAGIRMMGAKKYKVYRLYEKSIA
ncbi:MAG: hypothetical protein BGO98_19135 [Myxococcales bacterium 68-20]|nr:hypothetical protein [Myxococcales bacterium]OJY24835.1 MAG: hypothetical protein BGO98_19135 [Myxococcales bacterium 68-20]